MSCTTIPIVIVLPFLRLRAIWFGANCIFSMAARTALRLSSATRAVPFMMRDTVLADTPAARATSSRVVGLEWSSELNGCQCLMMVPLPG